MKLVFSILAISTIILGLVMGRDTSKIQTDQNALTESPTPSISEGLKENDITIATKYPLAPYLPFKSSDVVIDYVAPLTLRIKTSLSAEQAKAVCLEYAKTSGIDISNHTFVFESLN